MLDVLRYKICEHLDWRETAKVALTNKSNYNALRARVTEKKNEENREKMKEIFGFYFDNIREMLGEQNMNKAKYLPWQDQWMGATQYIECYKPKEIPTTFSYGIDPHGRFFIFIKINKIFHNKNGIKEIDSAIIIFRRYSNSDTVVCHDSRSSNRLIDTGSAVLSREKEEKIKQFISSKHIVYESTEWDPKTEIFLN